MFIYLPTSMIIFQLDDSKVNSEEDQNDDSDYNTSKKRKRGKKRKFQTLTYLLKKSLYVKRIVKLNPNNESF